MLSQNGFLNLEKILSRNRVIPVAVFNNVSDSVKLADLLLKNSINLIEVTLRTEIAFDCIREIKKNFPEIHVGCGSVLSISDFDMAYDSGAQFAVSPSLSKDILKHSSLKNDIYIPGVSTPTELHSALSVGTRIIKIFPAAALGGADYIKSILAPFAKMDFSVIPTGGVNENNLADFLNLPRVISCGASFIADSKLIEKGDFKELENRIRRIKEITG